MKVVKLTCPSCNAPVEADLEDMLMKCPYCHQSLAMDVDVNDFVAEKEKTKRLQMEYEQKRYEDKNSMKAFLGMGIFFFVLLGIMLICGLLGVWD